jgi:hypothetical protein
MWDMVQKRYWTVLPFSAVKHFPHLKLAPSGVVPQAACRPRPIMDYTFNDVNQGSLPVAPTAAMQFGFTLQRLLQCIAYANPSLGPPLLLKLDLSEGYYRVRLSPQATLELATLLPHPSGGRPLIGIPLSLPMGWRDSPPYFCAFTETAVDLTNTALANCAPSTPHPLEHASQHSPHTPIQEPTYHLSTVFPPTPGAHLAPLAYSDVYIDDFIGLAQIPCHTDTLRHLLHNISRIFRCDTPASDPPTRKQVISASKLLLGDGAWSTQNTILGWHIDTAVGTLALPPPKRDRLVTLLQSFAPLTHTSRRRWYSLLRELRHLSYAIRGSKHLFSILQHVLVDQPRATRLKLSPLVKSTLLSWQRLANTLATSPVPIASLVPRAPHYVGLVDASGAGCGDVWFPTTFAPSQTAFVFRMPFPQHIQNNLVSASNPSGTITNSDLELAAIVMGAHLLHSAVSIPHLMIYVGSDNTSAVSWCSKGSTTSNGPNAFLLHLLAQLTNQCGISIQPIFVHGVTNSLPTSAPAPFIYQCRPSANTFNWHTRTCLCGSCSTPLTP